jgi:hypothetical protein
MIVRATEAGSERYLRNGKLPITTEIPSLRHAET